MYSNKCIHGEKIGRFNTCIPHSELHPYIVNKVTNEIEPVTNLKPGESNIQTLSLFCLIIIDIMNLMIITTLLE